MKEEEIIDLNDIRIVNNKPEICVAVYWGKKGISGTEWEDYEEHILHTRVGQASETDQVHSLEYFRDIALENKSLEEKKTLKIRYAYISSPTTLRIDSAYYETLAFKETTLEKVEHKKGTLEEFITNGNAVVIKILGRDVCIGRKDMDGKEIYSGDVLRWVNDDYRPAFVDIIVDITTQFCEQATKGDYKILDTIYNPNRKVNNK